VDDDGLLNCGSTEVPLGVAAEAAGRIPHPHAEERPPRPYPTAMDPVDNASTDARKLSKRGLTRQAAS